MVLAEQSMRSLLFAGMSEVVYKKQANLFFFLGFVFKYSKCFSDVFCESFQQRRGEVVPV